MNQALSAQSSVLSHDHFRYVLRHADDNLVLAQRLSEWITRAPELEEDVALANIALDHLGQARALLSHAGHLEGAGRDEDRLAMFRSEREFTNLLLVEQPNGDFAQTIARQLLFDAYQLELWRTLSSSGDLTLAGIAQRAEKETRYHFRRSSTWVIRLGDGTEESHRRMQAGIDSLWRFTAEMFEDDPLTRSMAAAGMGCNPGDLRLGWKDQVHSTLSSATLRTPEDPFQRGGGRDGFHTEHLGHLLAEMQWMQRSNPGAKW